jgi:O-methyltransferase involved in polyketide biosynthesis
MAVERDARIAPTAYYTAYVWHRLKLPYGELFATWRGAIFFWAFRLASAGLALVSRRAPSTVQSLAVRHLTIDGELERLGPDLIIEIGAGLSRRGVTWAADRGVRYVEVDLPGIVAAKQAHLRRAPAALRERIDRQLQLVSFDILDPRFAAWLAAQLTGARRPVVIGEGLLYYFDDDERACIAAAVRRALAAAGGGVFLSDVRTREEGQGMGAALALLRAAIRLGTRGRGTRADFPRLADVRAFFGAAGFAVAAPLDRAGLPAALARLRSPVRVWSARAE